MSQDMNKHFNNDNNAYVDHQLIGHGELFKGEIVKEQVMSNQKQIDCRSHDIVIVKMCVKQYHECWKRRCVVSHNRELQRKVLQENVVAITKEASKGEVKGLRRYAEAHSVNENEA